MTVSYSIDEKSTTEKDRQVFGQALEKFYGSALYNDLINDLDVVIHLKDLGAGTRGSHDLNTGEIAVSPGTGRYQNTPNELLATMLHELTHSAQKLSREQWTADARRNSVGVVDRIVGSETNSAVALDKAGIFYGMGEPAAWLAANMRPGPQTKDPNVTAFIKANPEFSREYYRRNVQPHRPVTNHMKATPEMTLMEKMLNSAFGYQPYID